VQRYAFIPKQQIFTTLFFQNILQSLSDFRFKRRARKVKRRKIKVERKKLDMDYKNREAPKKIHVS
jgi:hypothetical protein